MGSTLLRVTMSATLTDLSDLCSLHSLPQPLYDLEAVGSSFTMCCIVGRFKETSSDLDKSEGKRKAAAKLHDKLRKFLENEEDMPDGVGIKNEHSNTTQMTFPVATPNYQIKSGR